MGHDELCLLSGIRPGGEPSNLLYRDSVDTVMVEITDEIKAISQTTPPDLDSNLWCWLHMKISVITTRKIHGDCLVLLGLISIPALPSVISMSSVAAQQLTMMKLQEPLGHQVDVMLSYCYKY